MALEVLLRRTIEGVGEVGEVVKVKNGYARNYLLPHGYAAVVSADALRRSAQDKKTESVRQDRLAEERKDIAEKLADLRLTMEARAGEDGHLYGSIGVRDILAAFAGQGFKFIERHLTFETVRELGQYAALVTLAPGEEVTVPVWVVQDAADAISMAEEARQNVAAEAAEAAGEASASDLPDVPDLDAILDS